MRLFAFLLIFISQTAWSQREALYYFDKGLAEFSYAFPELFVEGQRGSFKKEVVEKLGKEPRVVYLIPRNSGLMFDNSKIKNFISGSYGIEMYFRYDEASLLLYSQLLGDEVGAKQGKYVHLVTTRDAATKRLNIYLEGKLKFSFVDVDNNMEIDNTAKISFFREEGRETTSGAVAMIKLYDFFIDEETAKNQFEVFSNPIELQKSKIEGVLKNLYFVQSKSVLLPESSPELEVMSSFLKTNPKLKIELSGHTDNQGDFNLNLKLSKERAEAVKEFLVKSGIDAKRIKTKGYGSLKPIASNTTESTRSKNRRVELIFIN